MFYIVRLKDSGQHGDAISAGVPALGDPAPSAWVSGFIAAQNANRSGVAAMLNSVEIAVMLTDVATLPRATR